MDVNLNVKEKRSRKAEGEQVCPDAHSMCTDGQTCCRLSTGAYGCCPLPEVRTALHGTALHCTH